MSDNKVSVHGLILHKDFHDDFVKAMSGFHYEDAKSLLEKAYSRDSDQWLKDLFDNHQKRDYVMIDTILSQIHNLVDMIKIITHAIAASPKSPDERKKQPMFMQLDPETLANAVKEHFGEGECTCEKCTAEREAGKTASAQGSTTFH